MDRRERGRLGEESAAAYLRRHGYKILDMNYKCRMGEIDIIASKRSVLAFVEVKLRKSADFGAAREFVTPAKQERIKLTASMWLAANETELQPRFDVIEIYAPDGDQLRVRKIEHLKDAFQ